MLNHHLLAAFTGSPSSDGSNYSNYVVITGAMQDNTPIPSITGTGITVDSTDTTESFLNTATAHGENIESVTVDVGLLVLAAFGGTNPTATYLGYGGNTSDTGTNGSRTYTISGSFTTSDTIVINTHNQSSTFGDNRITAATINSQSATAAIIRQKSTNVRESSGIFYVTGISGSSLSITVNYTGSNVYRSACYAYKINETGLSVEKTEFIEGGGAANLDLLPVSLKETT